MNDDRLKEIKDIVDKGDISVDGYYLYLCLNEINRLNDRLILEQKNTQEWSDLCWKLTESGRRVLEAHKL